MNEMNCFHRIIRGGPLRTLLHEGQIETQRLRPAGDRTPLNAADLQEAPAPACQVEAAHLARLICRPSIVQLLHPQCTNTRG